MEEAAWALGPVEVEGKGHSRQQVHRQEIERPCQCLARGLGWRVLGWAGHEVKRHMRPKGSWVPGRESTSYSLELELPPVGNEALW